MVTNEEISGKSENGLLVCVNCEYSYKLEPGESPEDFILECSCGGKLNYLKPKREVITRRKGFAEKKYSQNKFKKTLGSYICILGCLVSIILILMDHIFFGIILMVCTAYIGIRLYDNGLTNTKRWKKGIIGEKTVANYLNQLPKDYYIFNDVKFPGSYGNLDHVVVGPNGIFVIETKNYSGNFFVEDDVWYYKNRNSIKESSNQPGKQVMRNVMSLKKFLEKNKIKMNGVWIEPIVTLVKENFEIINKPKHYEILYPSAIPKFIKNKKNKVEHNILQSAIDLIEPYSNELSYIDQDER